MTEDLLPRYTTGTHRLCSPDETLARISPALARCGITRVAEITGLDEDLGVPTYTAIRPAGATLQASSGKGLTAAAARVSAVMEAIELDHAERPDAARIVHASAAELRRRGLDVRLPSRDQADEIFHYAADRVIGWIEGQELITGAVPWIPVSASCFVEPTIYRTSTNGLASGNHVVEATLHALCELLERDAISRLAVDGTLRVSEQCRIVDTSTVDDEALLTILARIRAAGSQLVLLWVPAQAPVHVFWAVLLDHHPGRAATALITGAGAHVDLRVAATRAITEAVQSRLTIVQAAREDILSRPSFSREGLEPGPAFRFFAELPVDTDWAELAQLLPGVAPPAADLRERLDQLLRALADAGHTSVFRVDLTRPELRVPVVKVIVPSLRFRRELF